MGKFDKLNQELVRVNNAQGGPNAAALDDRFQLLNNTLVNTQQEWEDYVARRQQEQEALDEYSHGRGNRSYLREDYGTGSYTEGMDAVKRRRQQSEWEKANADYEAALQEYNKAAETTRRVSAVAGPISPEKRREIDAAKSTEQSLKERLDALKASADKLKLNDSGFTKWEGRDALVKEYRQLQTELEHQSRRSPERMARFDEVKRQLQEGDRAAGNGAADYSIRDRSASIFGGAAKRIAGGVANTALTAVDLMEKYSPYMDVAKAVNNRFGSMSPNPAQHRAGMDRLYAAADSISDSAAKDLDRAKAGLGKMGQAGVDTAENVLEMGFDAAVGALTGGGSLVSMFARVFGDSAREARQQGATLEQQVGYGVAAGGIEVLTEKLFDGVAGIYGKGAADNITETVIRRLSSTPTGQTLLRGLIGAINEGNEEVLSDLLNPLAQAIYRDDSLGQLYREVDPAEVLYDFLIGAAVGGLGSVTSAATGQDAAKNAENNYITALYEQSGERPGFGREVRDRAILERQMTNPDAYNAANLSTKENAQEAMRALRGQQTETARAQELQQTQREMTRQNAETMVPMFFSASGITLDENQRGRLMKTLDDNNIKTENFAWGTRDAYNMGEQGATMEETVQAIGEKYGLSPKQARTAWSFGASNAQTTATGTADVSTEEGRQTVEAALSFLGERTEDAVKLYDSRQDVGRMATAMNKAVLYAAHGADVRENVQNARDGKAADVVGVLTDEQARLAQEIGAERRARQQAADKALGESYRDMRQKAAAITGTTTVSAQALEAVDTAIDATRKAGQRVMDEFNTLYNALEALEKADPNAKNSNTYKEMLDRAYKLRDKAQNAQKQIRELEKRKAQIEGKKTIQRKKGTVSFAGGTIEGVKYDGVDPAKLSRQQQKVVAMVERLADAVNLDYVFISADAGMGGAYTFGGRVYININAGLGVGNFSQTMAAASLSHEMTHWMQQYAPEEYSQLKDFIVQEILKADPQKLQKLVQQQKAWEKGRALTDEQALDEVVANACQTMLLDSKAIDKLARQNMSLAARIADWIADWSQKVKDAFAEVDVSEGAIYEAVRALDGSLDRIQELWDNGIEAAAKNYDAQQTVEQANVAQKATNENAAQKGDVQKQAWKPIEFGEEVQQWYDNTTSQERLDSPEFFNVGTTSEALKSIGVKDGILIWGKSKMEKILLDHAGEGIDLDVIKQVPDITERPVFVLKSKTVPGSIVLFGTVETKTGRKMLATVSLTPGMGKNLNVDLSVITGAYSRRNNQMRNMLTSSEILYIDGTEENERTNEWLKQLGLQLPSRSTNVGSVGSITYTADGVKISGKTWEELFGEDAEQESKAQNQTQFQMISDVEETPRLVAVHNKSVSGLQRMMERGGVPFPSIAIKKAGTSHEGFGDVSIVFPRSTIDPAASRWNRLYSNDAWTPTEPRTEYEADEKITSKVKKAVEKLVGSTAYNALNGSSYLHSSQVERALLDSNGDVFNAFKNLSVVKYAYLKSKGQDVELPAREKPLDGSYRYQNSQFKAIFDEIDGERLATAKWDDMELAGEIAGILNRQYEQQLQNSTSRNKDKLLAAIRRKPLYSADDINLSTIRYAYETYQRDGGKFVTETDSRELDNVLRNNTAVESDPDYRAWIEQTFQGVVKNEGIPNGKELYTDSGNMRSFKARHVPATLENIVQQMRKENERGNGLFGVNLRGAATKAYSSVEEMRQDAGKLLGTHVSDDVYDGIMEGFHNRLHEMASAATKYPDRMSSYDTARETLLEAVRDAKSKAAMSRMLQKNSDWIRYTPELTDELWTLRNDVQNMPAPYFEAKPRRIVYPEEALAYILPDSAPADLIQKLEGKGYNVMTYKAGDEQDRLQKLNSVEGAQFQQWDNEESATGRLDREATDRQHNAWAPTFYSKMENAVREWTNGKGQPLGAKMAAGQVIGWLKGKGVKVEEIRWSGIVPWLEGRKAVTKDELLQVMAENQIRIETEMLGSKIVKPSYYYQGMDPRDGSEREMGDVDELFDYIDELAADMGLEAGTLVGEPDPFNGWIHVTNKDTGELITTVQLRDPVIEKTTRWGAYALNGGFNYREILFKMPSLGGYTNQAMGVHWGVNDVIAHARVQDMTDMKDRSVLFVEEIQSDLHNEGANKGFMSKEDQEYFRLRRKQQNESLTAEEQKALSKLTQDRFGEYQRRVDAADKKADEDAEWARELAPSLRERLEERGVKGATDDSVFLFLAGINWTPIEVQDPYGFATGPESEAMDAAFAAMTDEEVDRRGEAWRNRNELTDAETLLNAARRKKPTGAPDVPFAGSADTYHEYVMKNLLRLAAEGDYDMIAWTTADMQSNRWSDDYAEGYRIEYDQEIPKFMRKYVRQWGATVESTDLYTDNGEEKVWAVPVNDAMKQSVLTEGQPLFQRWDDTDGDTAAEANGREEAYTRLQSENKILSNTIKGLNKLIAKKDTTIGQLQDRLKLNKTPEVREVDAKKLARKLLREHNSIADFEGVAADIKALGDYLVQAKEVGEDEVKSRARNIAAEILQNATEQYQMEDEQLDTIRGEVKGRKLTISPDFLGELDQAGGYDLFRRQNFGKFTLARADSKNINRDDYMSVSQFYADMQNQYGKTYFPDAANEGEEAIILASVMQAADPIEVNPYRQYMGEATEELANRITQDALNGILRLEPDRYADAEYLKEKSRNEALNARVKQLVEENALSKEEARKLWQQVNDLNTQLEHADLQYRALMNAAEDRIWQVRAEGIVREVMTKAKERERAAKNIQALKDHYKELQQNARERRQEAAGAGKYRKQIEKKAAKLYEMLAKNDDKLHVPEVLKQPLGEFLESLDFTSKRGLAGGEETQKDKTFALRLQKIQQILANQQDYINGGDMKQDLGGYIDVSEANLDFLRRVSEMITTALSEGRDYTINQMTAAELKDLSNFLSNLTTAIRNMNGFMANARFETVREAASQDIETIKALGKASETENGKLFSAAVWENGTPYYVFRRFGEGGKAIFDSFTRGWEKMAFNVQKVMDFTEETYSDKEVREWQKERHEIELEDGSKVTMTTGQIMSLSMLLNREQARKHMDKGGVRIGDIQGKKGSIKDITHYHLTEADISNIIGQLTDRQAEVARKLQRFMAEQGSEWGNEISMRRFGYNFYTEGENYFPIKTDSADQPMRDTDAQQNSMFRLLNLSASKSLNPKASNALVVEDIFDVFADHMSDMAKLNGMGLPILDAIKWFNYKERIDLGDGQYDTRTMQAAMEQAFGDKALSYFRTLMKDINGVTESGDRGADPFARLVSNYKAAAVAANLRVAFLQPTSYVRASYLIKPRYLMQAFTNKNAYKEAMEYSGTAVWKSLGYYDTNIARGMRDQIKHNESWKDKVVEKSMGLAELGDKLTWGRLWVACKMQAAAETGLQGEELKQKTADLFREVIYSSQVMDSTLTRSELMRGKSMHTKALTAFMAEPTLSYNMVMDAGMEYHMNARKYGKAEAWQRSKGYIAKAFTVYTCSAAFSAVVESIADAFRDDDDEESFLLKWSQAMFGEGNLLKGNLAQDLDLFGKQPYLRNVMSLLQGYKNRDMSVAALEVFIDTYKIWKETINLATGALEKPTKTTYYGKMTTWGKIYKTMQALSQATGLAVANLSRDVFAVWNTTVGSFNPEWKMRTYDSNSLSASKVADWETYVKDSGISKSKFKSILSSADVDGTASPKQDELGAYLVEALGKGEITEEQAQAVWKSQWHSASSKTFDKWRDSQGKAEETQPEAPTETPAPTPTPKPQASLSDFESFKKSVSLYGDKKEAAYRGWENEVKPLGVSLDSYVKIINAADAAGDGNGSVKQDEMGMQLVQKINRRELTYEQAEAIWHTIWNGARSKTFYKWYNG